MYIKIHWNCKWYGHSFPKDCLVTDGNNFTEPVVKRTVSNEKPKDFYTSSDLFGETSNTSEGSRDIDAEGSMSIYDLAPPVSEGHKLSQNRQKSSKSQEEKKNTGRQQRLLDGNRKASTSASASLKMTSTEDDKNKNVTLDVNQTDRKVESEENSLKMTNSVESNSKQQSESDYNGQSKEKRTPNTQTESDRHQIAAHRDVSSLSLSRNKESRVCTNGDREKYMQHIREHRTDTPSLDERSRSHAIPSSNGSLREMLEKQSRLTLEKRDEGIAVFLTCIYKNKARDWSINIYLYAFYINSPLSIEIWVLHKLQIFLKVPFELDIIFYNWA